MPQRLVFELGTEELPPGAAWEGLRQIREAAAPALRAARIPCGPVSACSTPRRIALIVERVAPVQEDLVREVRGPAARIAFAPDGSPTKAAEGFARAQGVPPSALERRRTAQGEYVFARLRSPGGPTLKALADLLPALASGLAFPKAMRWGPDGIRFARPIRWVLAVLGGHVVPFEFAGVRSGRVTYGHRTLSPAAITVADARGFEAKLRRHRVLLDPAARRRRITLAVARVAESVGGRAILDPDLLEETVQLVEWPEALAGTFASEFLTLPREVLITVMQHHQKYFAVEDAAGRLLPAFVAIRNGGTRGLRTVREGNEWVLRARLADARFFFEEDRTRPLEARIGELGGLIVHEKLGTMAQKRERLIGLAERLGRLLALDNEQSAHLRRAADLCKADLVTQIVREFPELQGVAGGIYAQLDGEPAPVAQAIREQYLPRGSVLPRTEAGAYLALLDKLDNLLGALAVGLAATGSEDPYGLRRAAQGIVAIVLDRKIRLDMRQIARDAPSVNLGQLPPSALAQYSPFSQPVGAKDQYQLQHEAAVDAAMDLLRQRLRSVLIDSGISYDTVDAVLAAGYDDLLDAAVRARALWAFRQ
ncbi:MAG TPA: glycine--tRNA ligase subunit beta, partial [bacterium]|nr:glycine--tRNA ligase subunit beta [bacterium]